MLVRILIIAYGRLALPAALVLAGLAAIFHPKLRASLWARVGIRKRLREAATRRDTSRPLIWFHVASAGELLQAEPVMNRCRDGGAQVAMTLTSVSGLDWITRLADWPELVWADVLPPDFPGAARRMWDVLQPSALIFVQADVWPGLIAEAGRRGTPVFLVAARLGEDSFRLVNPLGRAVYGHLYRRLHEILAVGEADRGRLARLVPGHGALSVGGDPGVDTAIERVSNAARLALPASYDPSRVPVIVVGSSWPADEARWVPVVQRALERFPHLRIVVVPHEPSEARLRALEAEFAAHAPQRLSLLAGEDSPAETRVVLADTVGVLAALYGVGSIAYVGGGFSTGVHNVAEPAAAGIPVIFGPRHGNSAVAEALLAEGAAFAVGDEGALERCLLPLLENPAGARDLGARARTTVERLCGAADGIYAHIAAAVPGLGR